MTQKKSPRDPGQQGCVPRPGSSSLDVVFGVHAVRGVLSRGAEGRPRVLHFFATPNVMARLLDLEPFFPFPPERVHPRELEAWTGKGVSHQGVCLVLEKRPDPVLEDVLDRGPLVILDQVTDPHNVGAILRSCAAFSVRALITTARHSPSDRSIVHKAASGGGELVPHVSVVNLARTLETLKREGFWILGLEGSAPAYFHTSPLLSSEKVAIVLGAEGRGLRPLTAKNCDFLGKLQLPGALQSLNVSNAAALALHLLWAGKAV